MLVLRLLLLISTNPLAHPSKTVRLSTVRVGKADGGNVPWSDHQLMR